MEMSAEQGSERYTSKGLRDRELDGELVVPIKKIGSMESIVAGFRMKMFDIRDDDNKVIGSVSTGSGLGNDSIIVEWRDQSIFLTGEDLLKAYVKQVDPESAFLSSAVSEKKDQE